MTRAQRAFVFDMDGTIVDNMDFHTQSWIEFFRRRSMSLEPHEFFRVTAGRQGKEIIRTYLGEDMPDDEVAALNHEKEEIYRELYEPHRKELDGFSAFVAEAKQRGIALA